MIAMIMDKTYEHRRQQILQGANTAEVLNTYYGALQDTCQVKQCIHIHQLLMSL